MKLYKIEYLFVRPRDIRRRGWLDHAIAARSTYIMADSYIELMEFLNRIAPLTRVTKIELVDEYASLANEESVSDIEDMYNTYWLRERQERLPEVSINNRTIINEDITDEALLGELDEYR